MSNLKDITGMKFNNLLVVQRAENSERGKASPPRRKEQPRESVKEFIKNIKKARGQY